MKELKNISHQEIINRAKEKIHEKRKAVRASFTKMNPQKKLILNLEKKRLKYEHKFNNDLTNNPRYENISINTDLQDFNFYKSFVEAIATGKNESQKSLFK